GMTSMAGRPARWCSTRYLVRRSIPYAMAATPYSVSARRLRRDARSADALFLLLVLDAEVRVREGLDAELLDGLAAPVAQPIRPFGHLGQGLVDALDQVLKVVEQGFVALPLEGGRSGVGELLVEPHLAGHLGLGRGEAGVLEVLQLGGQLGPLLRELLGQLLD